MIVSRRTTCSRQIFLTLTAGLLLSSVSGCGGSDNPAALVTRQVPATYTRLDGEPFVPNDGFGGAPFVCTINAADIPGSPQTIRLSYEVVPTDYGSTIGPPEAVLRNGRYRFFLRTPGDSAIFTVRVSSPTETVSLPPLVFPRSGGNNGPGTGIPVFTTNPNDEIVVSAPSNTSVTLTADASRVQGSPSVVSVTYKGPITGPAQATLSGGQYVIGVQTGTVTENTRTSIVLGNGQGFNEGTGPTVAPQ